MLHKNSNSAIYLVGIVVGLLVFLGPEILDQVGAARLDMISLAISTAIGVFTGVVAGKLFILALHKVYRDE